MADTIQVRAGNKANMPVLADRELAYVKDEKALYVGTPEGNVKILWGDIEKRLEATRAASVAALASDADLTAVMARVNELIAALKAANIMTS